MMVDQAGPSIVFDLANGKGRYAWATREGEGLEEEQGAWARARCAGRGARCEGARGDAGWAMVDWRSARSEGMHSLLNNMVYNTAYTIRQKPTLDHV